MSNSNYWPTYAIIVLLVIMGGLFAFYSTANNERLTEEAKQSEDKKIAVNDQANIENTGQDSIDSTVSVEADETDWRKIYPKTQDLKIAEVMVKASVARTWAERIRGLSDTPYLPEDVVKLFVFDSLGEHSIWMKDMNYAIDIIWVDAKNKIVDIKENATPESYPEAFSPKADALYVIETKVGFVAKNNIKIGDEVLVPKE